MVRFRVLDLLWKTVGRIVRFCIVHHPVRGTIFLLSTYTSLTALEILQLYGYRSKIELGFRQAVHILGAYAYHFWMLGMKPLRRGAGDQYLLEPQMSTGPPFAESCAPTMSMSSSAASLRVLGHHDKALPFEPLIPNKTTIAAMHEARAGNLPGVNNVNALMAALHADD